MRLDIHLLDVIKKQKRDITKSQQKQIISIFKGLDKDNPRIEFNIETVDYII